MKLTDYLRILRRHWLLMASTALIGILTASLYTLAVNPVYSAKTQLFVSIQSSGTIQELQQGNAFSQARVKSYIQTATTPVVLQPVIDELGLDTTPAQLAKTVTASADLNTVMITIMANSPSPVEAAAIAQATGRSLISAVEQLEKSSEQAPSPVKLSTVTPAIAPTSPSSPNTQLNLGIGLLVGLGVGALLALTRTALDTRIRGEAGVRKLTDRSILGGIAYDGDAAKKPLLTQAAPQSPRAESFRQIRTNLQFANISSTSRTTLVTSSLPGEGKSTTATNMAIALAQAGQHVVLVDADLRRPSVAAYLGLEGNAGLTTALVGDADVEDLLQPWGSDDLHVLTAGIIPPNPSELLGSEEMTKLIGRLENRFDIVIIDAPPLIPVTDASVLSQKVGGVVLVVGSGKVKSQEFEKSLASLHMVNASVLGIVLNLLPTKGADAYAYSYYSYASQTNADEGKRVHRRVLQGNSMKNRRSRGSESRQNHVTR